MLNEHELLPANINTVLYFNRDTRRAVGQDIVLQARIPRVRLPTVSM